MSWIGIIVVFGLGVGYVKPCYLSSKDDTHGGHSWVVSLRNVETERLVCVGILVAKNFVTAPVSCFQIRPSGGFYNGRMYEASSGKNVIGVESCYQVRRGLLVMGHPKLAEDRFIYNIAYLQVEPFDIDPVNPPVAPLPISEKSNNAFLGNLMTERATCHFWWFNDDGSDDLDNQLEATVVIMISRSRCWDLYCPSGNPGCVSYFWSSDTYVCSRYKPENQTSKCSQATIGAPLVCNGTAVGVLRSCYRDRPLMTQGFNQKQLKGIHLYQKIAAGDVEVEVDEEEQKEPQFPSVDKFDNLWHKLNT